MPGRAAGRGLLGLPLARLGLVGLLLLPEAALATDRTPQEGPKSPAMAASEAGNRATSSPNATQGGQSAANEGQPADEAPIDLLADTPPKTAYDRLGEAHQPSLAPESFAMVRQLGRTVLALLFTCALIYLFFRLGLPRLYGIFGQGNEQTFRIRERVPLDGSHQLVRLEAESGETYLLGVGSGGIQLIEKWPAPPGEPLPEPRRPRTHFAEALRGTPTDPSQGTGGAP